MKKSNVVSSHVSKSVHEVQSNNAVVSPTVTSPPATPSLAARVAAATQLLQQAVAILALEPVNLSAKDVKYATKFVNGGEDHLGTLATLSAKYRVEVPARPTTDMSAAFADAKTLEPLQLDVQAFSKLLEDSVFQGRSETWTTATTLYTMLRQAAVREPTLKEALVPIKQFFGRRGRAVTTEATTAKAAKKAAKATSAPSTATQTPATQATVVSDAPVTAKPAVVAATAATPVNGAAN